MNNANIIPCECQKKAAKDRFQAAEAMLLTALNGLRGAGATDAEITELRRDLMQARKACEDLGVEVETLWEFAEKRRKIEEGHVRRYADEQSKVVPMLPYVLRQQLSKTIGAFVFAAVLLEWTTFDGLFGALVSGLVAFAIVEGILSDLFPTPPVRVARMACEFGVDVSDIWPKGSIEFRDYVRGYKRHELRMSRRGESIGWVRAR